MAKISQEERNKDLEEMNRITSKSKLTKKDIEDISRKIKREAAKRFKLLSE